MAVPPGEERFDDFYKDLKETEQKDSVLTPKQQIDRLLRPGKRLIFCNHKSHFMVLLQGLKTPKLF